MIDSGSDSTIIWMTKLCQVFGHLTTRQLLPGFITGSTVGALNKQTHFLDLMQGVLSDIQVKSILGYAR